MSHHPFQSDTVRTFNGLARVIIAATPGEDLVPDGEKRQAGEIIVQAKVRGWETRELRLQRTHEGLTESIFQPDKRAPRATDVYDQGVPPVD